MPHPGALRFGRDEQRLLLHHAELPGREAGGRDRRAGFDGLCDLQSPGLRGRARGVWKSYSEVPGLAPSLRRTLDQYRGGAVARLPRTGSHEPGPARGQGNHHGQTLYFGAVAKGYLRLHADLWRLRLHDRIPHRPHMARYPPQYDRGGHFGNHEGDHRQGGEDLNSIEPRMNANEESLDPKFGGYSRAFA